MHELGRRRRNQPAPPHAVFESLTDYDRAGARRWLNLLPDEQPPHVLRTRAPSVVVWSSIFIRHPEVFIEFDIATDGAEGTDLCWTLSIEGDPPDDATVGHLRKRMNVLINADLRYSFGQ